MELAKDKNNNVIKVLLLGMFDYFFIIRMCIFVIRAISYSYKVSKCILRRKNVHRMRYASQQSKRRWCLWKWIASDVTGDIFEEPGWLNVQIKFPLQLFEITVKHAVSSINSMLNRWWIIHLYQLCGYSANASMSRLKFKATQTGQNGQINLIHCIIKETISTLNYCTHFNCTRCNNGAMTICNTYLSESWLDANCLRNGK